MIGTTCQKISPVILLVRSPVMVITSPSCAPRGGGRGSLRDCPSLASPGRGRGERERGKGERYGFADLLCSLQLDSYTFSSQN